MREDKVNKKIIRRQDRVEVELKRLKDRALNRDLEKLCAKVAKGSSAYRMDAVFCSVCKA